MKIILFSALLAFLLSGFSTSDNSINLTDAVNSHQVSVSAIANGGLGADNLTCNVTNRTRTALNIKVPSGLHFLPTDPDKQDLLTVKESVIALEPGGTASFLVGGYCMKASSLAPSINNQYKFKGYAPANLKKLAEMLGQNEQIAKSYGQMFVWAITDNRKMYSIGVPENDKEKATDIVKFVSSVTNLPAPEVVTASAGTAKIFTPSVEVFSNSAFVVFHNPSVQSASFKMYDADGNENHTFYSNRRLTPGVKKYQVGVNHIVPAGSPAVFYLKVISNSGEVLAEKKISRNTIAQDIEPELINFDFMCNLAQAAKNVRLKVYLADGTLVEEVSQYKYMPVGMTKIKTKFLHLYPANTEFIAKLEGADGKIHATQTIAKRP